MEGKPDYRKPTSPKDVRLNILKRKRLKIALTFANPTQKSSTILEGVGLKFRIKK